MKVESAQWVGCTYRIAIHSFFGAICGTKVEQCDNSLQ